MFFKKLETTQEACFHNTLGGKKNHRTVGAYMNNNYKVVTKNL